MLDEVTAASQFVAGLLQAPDEQRRRFEHALRRSMLTKFQSHWYLEEPNQGNGYRSLMKSGQFVDPLLVRAAAEAGVRQPIEFAFDFTLWVDPFDVSYRVPQMPGLFSVDLPSSSVLAPSNGSNPAMMLMPPRVSSPLQQLSSDHGGGSDGAAGGTYSPLRMEPSLELKSPHKLNIVSA